MSHLVVLEENVHGFVQRVAENFDHLLVHVRIVTGCAYRVIGLLSGKREGERAALVRAFEHAYDFRIALGRPEAHHDVVRVEHGVDPRSESQAQIHRRQRALSDDDGMNELYRDVLRVGRVSASSECQQTAAAAKSLERLSAGQRQRTCLLREERVGNNVAVSEALDDPLRQHIRGRGSPTSMSMIRLPP